MAKLVAVHRMPQDPKAYDRHYFDVHVPLAKALPGLRKYEVSVGPITEGAAETDIHLVAILEFDNVADVEAALASEAGQAAADDMPKLAADANIQLAIFDTREL